MIDYPRGSKWRKWDLHVHTPLTKCNDGYRPEQSEDIWDKFCREIEESDVEVIGITDYFSIENFYIFKDKFKLKYPDSKKIFFPNIELKLNESVNQEQEEVNIHLIFRPEITREKSQKFLDELKTEITDSNDTRVSCTELTLGQFESATVTRESIKAAIKATFGEKIRRQDWLIIITAANNDGVRPHRGSHRKENITDQIDKFSDAYFGGSQNRIYFLTTDRLEDQAQLISPKPVFSGSDPHDFVQLESWLGQQIRSEGVSKEITWVKADPTFEGLQQTLIEPEDRIAIKITKPDQKDLHKIIDKVLFSGTTDFPTTPIKFNSNLCSIIGSRSSGKSALLAYIAHSVNETDTIERQINIQNIKKEEAGPAAGKSWKDVENITCEVVWGSGLSTGGNIVYIPQNYLYSISSRPSEITSKIEPVLFKRFPQIKDQYEKTMSELLDINQSIKTAAETWFGLKESGKQIQNELREFGDKAGITATKHDSQSQIEVLKTKYSVTEEDITLYQQIALLIARKKDRQGEITNEKVILRPFLTNDNGAMSINIKASITFQPTIDGLSGILSESLRKIVDDHRQNISSEIELEIRNYYDLITKEFEELTLEIITIESDNKDLFEKYQQNEVLTTLIKNVSKQDSVLTLIDGKENEASEKDKQALEQIELINQLLSDRCKALQSLVDEFLTIDQSSEEMIFGVESSFDDETKRLLAERFNRNSGSDYLDLTDNQLIDLEKVRSDAGVFLEAIYSGSQRIKTGLIAKQISEDMLIATEEIRFTAILEGDKIGGFGKSSMTPGKRALFALTLMLSEIDDQWPLLIDQPEDDLDSRSIYEQIVPYLIERKKERQIILVSHNANLVIGADSEQVIVANKHGADRNNNNGQTFDYITGSLEHTKSKDSNPNVLESCGIREHSCEILDGGEEAFEKRRNKYNI